MLLIVHTDSHDFDLQLFKFACLLRQTAQLCHAEGSPVASVEIEEHPGATLPGKSKTVTVLVLQAEIRRGFACRGGGLWLGIGAKLGKRRGRHETHGE